MGIRYDIIIIFLGKRIVEFGAWSGESEVPIALRT